MAKRTQKTRKIKINFQNLVTAAQTNDLEEAKEYEVALKTNDIPATVREKLNPSTNEMDFAVMVPEDFLDEAHVIIESQGAYDDLYDLTADNDNDYDNFENFPDDDDNF